MTDRYEVDDDPGRIDLDAVCGYLITEVYWARWRSEEVVRGQIRDAWRMVISIGSHVDPAELGELPPNVRLHRWVPQLAVLARASAFITHAGMGGCSEGLYQGVPMVAVPQAVDQFGNAALLERLGVGITVLAGLSAELRAAGGARAVADIAESLIRRRGGVG